MDFYLKTKNREALDNINKIGTINEKKIINTLKLYINPKNLSEI